MKIELNDLYQGKSTLIGKKQYLCTSDYIDPFIQTMSKFTDQFICNVKEPKQITVGEEKDMTYNRVYIQAILPKKYWEYENHQQVVSMIYGLDCKTPIVKLFRGGLNMACTNLCVFSSSFLNCQPLLPQEMYDITPIKRLMEITDDLEVKIRKLKDTYISRDEEDMRGTLGNWVDFCIRSEYRNEAGKAKLSPNTAIKAYSNLIMDEKSFYYTAPDEEVCLFTAFNAFTEIIRDDKDVINPCEKVLLLSQLFDL